jgi:zinc protease
MSLPPQPRELENDVSRIVLDNGLTVLIKEMHHAPVATFWVFYRVGSRNEIPGITGASHWVEHMMFKGTPAFPNKVLDRVISRVGGYWNAFTSFDFTSYFETMPAGEISLSLRIESDRMVSCLFSPEEVASERSVIISERQGMENSPTFLLAEEVRAAAFRIHPYRHEVIGDMADLQVISRDDLYAHYQTYYAPNNAIVVAVGDFGRDAMLAGITQSFGRMPPGPEIPSVHRAEPAQRGERRVTVEGEGSTAYLVYTYRAPCASDPDFFPLSVLGAALLGGGTGPLGDGGSNKSSRLYKALVETELAAGVSGGLMSTVDPSLYTVSATVRAGRTLSEVESALEAELQGLLTSRPVTEAELVKAVKRAKAAFAFSSESVTNQGFWLGLSEVAAGSYRWFQDYVTRLQQVTVDDVAEVAARYFDKRQRTVGWYLPQANGGAETNAHSRP